MGYAHVGVEIDAGKPLKPGVLIRGKKGAFWQQFVHENLLVIYYQCRRLGHANECCRFSEGDPSSDSGDCSLLPKNFVTAVREASLEAPVPMMVEGKGGDGGGRPRLGPWLVTSRIRQPWTPRVSMKGRDMEKEKEKVPCPTSSDPYSSFSPQNSPTTNTSSPSSPPDLDG